MKAAATAVVTGSNKGLGYFTAEELARTGFEVVLVGRRRDRLDTARATLESRVPGAKVKVAGADFSSLPSARAGRDALESIDVTRIDVLVNNAGIIHGPPAREVTADGLELVMATNLIGQVAWLDSIYELLSPQARIVWIGSLGSRIWDSTLTDFYCEDPYKPWRAYTQSKIAVQVFAMELARRLNVAGSRLSSIVADPGYSLGGLTIRVPGINNPNFRRGPKELLQLPIAQGKHTGSAPIIHAARAAGVRNGDGWSPRWWVKGSPVQRRLPRTSTDREIGLRVWERVVADAGASHLAAALPRR